MIARRDEGRPWIERDGRLTVRRLPIPLPARRRARPIWPTTRFFFIAAFVVLTALHAAPPLQARAGALAAGPARVRGARAEADGRARAPRPPRVHAGVLRDEVRRCRSTTGRSAPSPRSSRRASGSPTSRSRARSRCARRSSGAAPTRTRSASSTTRPRRTIFDPERHPPRGRDNGRFTLICHGSVEERYGLDTAIRAVASLADEIPELRLQIFGKGVAAARAARARQRARRARSRRVQRQVGADRGAPGRDRGRRRRDRRDEARRVPRPRPLQQDVRPDRDAAACDQLANAVGRGLLLRRRAPATSRRRTTRTSRARSGACTPSPSWAAGSWSARARRSSPTAGRASGSSTRATCCRPVSGSRPAPTATCRRRSSPRRERRR